MREAVRAIRDGVAVGRPDDVHLLRVSGADAWDALDRLCAGDLFLRDGQIRPGLLLDEDARPLASCHVARDDEDALLLLEGPTAAELRAHLEQHLPSGADVAVRDLVPEVALLTLDGPFAWELLALVAGAECVGLPYLTFFHHDRGIVYRAGETGEYGYGMLVPRGEADALEQRLLDAGRPLDVVRAGRDALEQCALENWFFNIRREGREPVTPLELQLQWRVSSRKAFVGSEALGRRRAAGVAQRLACLVGDVPCAVGDAVRLEGVPVGRVVNAGFSDARGDWVALALVDVAWAHPGIGFEIAAAAGTGAARSVSPPVVNNRSLHVSPQLHTYATRGEYAFPPLPRTSP
jgi:glycine cleavage system T protein (aminomethyltransferase)